MARRVSLSYRCAQASVVAPFDYTAMVWAFIFGYALFGETPATVVFLGALTVAAAGHEVAPIGAERNRPYNVPMPDQRRPNWLTCLGIPKAHRAVETPRSDASAVRTESNSDYVARVPLKRFAYLLMRPRIP